MIDSPSKAIAELGGAKSVAERIGCPVTTVASWAARNSIPVKVWPDLIAFAKTKGKTGFTYEALTVAHTKRSAA